MWRPISWGNLFLRLIAKSGLEDQNERDPWEVGGHVLRTLQPWGHIKSFDDKSLPTLVPKGTEETVEALQVPCELHIDICWLTF